MAVDLGKIEGYAYDLGIYDLEIALELMREGKLPPAKVKALEDVTAFAQQNGVKDLQAEVMNYNKGRPKAPFKDRYMRYALENDMPPAQAITEMLKRQNDDVQNVKEQAEKAGLDPKAAVAAIRNSEHEEIKKRADDMAEQNRLRQVEKLHGIGKGYYDSPEYHKKYWRARTGDKEIIESDPFFGSDAFKENVLKYSPQALGFNEDILSGLRKSGLASRLENLGRKPLPERELYNNMLQQYQYEQARRNPLNVLTGRYEYLRPKAYGEESPWVTGLRNRLGYTPVNSFNQ